LVHNTPYSCCVGKIINETILFERESNFFEFIEVFDLLGFLGFYDSNIRYCYAAFQILLALKRKTIKPFFLKAKLRYLSILGGFCCSFLVMPRWVDLIIDVVEIVIQAIPNHSCVGKIIDKTITSISKIRV
jgi:hypothetical protein